MGPTAERRQYQKLIWSLAFFLAIHVVALVAIATLIRPGFDQTLPALERASYVGDHRWLWRLGWLPWQLSALSDLLVSYFLIQWLRARLAETSSVLPPDQISVRKSATQAALRWAYVAAVLNVLATVPEQVAEWVTVTSHIETARDVATGRDLLSTFVDEQRSILAVSSVWAAFVYLPMTLAWHRSLALAAGMSRTFSGFAGKLVLVSMGTLGLSVLFVAGQVWFDWKPTLLLSAAAGIGFVLLCVWSLAAADLAGRAFHSDAQDASLHHLVWPSESRINGLADVLNSKGLRDLTRLLPWVNLRSDITDVVYLNWLVPTKNAVQVLPDPLRCDDLDGLTAVSVLTFRHGSFGPRFFGPLRSLLPSPLQSNWRLYLQPVGSDGVRDAIYFFKSVLNSSPHVAGARLAADGLPAHRSLSFVHERVGDCLTTRIDAGQGSSPDLAASVVENDDRVLPDAWDVRFDNWEAAAAYLIDQNAAVHVDQSTRQPWESRIAIPIELSMVKPVSVTNLEVSGIPNELLPEHAIVEGGARVFAFSVPAVQFEALGERLIR